MSFCTFSKEFNENACTEVENRFIAKYLPDADGFAVKVYLYGLYLCQKSDPDFSVRSMAEVLGESVEKIEEAFLFWQDYDLVEVLSREPFVVNYLSVRAAVGRPKKVRYERYADFNKELQRRMQEVGKFVSYNDSIKYMQFLEDNDIQPQAFLLIAEHCIHKQGEAVSPSYIFNKAKKFIRNGWHTYEQVEKELSGYHAHEEELVALFALLSVYRKPDETDYALYKTWTEEKGFEKDCVFLAAKRAKRGGMDALNGILTELYEKGKTATDEAESYLSTRDTLVAMTFKIARKLGAKIGNPAAYVDEYAERWYNYGFEEDTLADLATYCFKTDRTDFGALDEIVKELFKNGVVSAASVDEYLKAKNDELRLFTKIRGLCGNLKKSAANLSLIETWRGWNFSDEMILEAAKRSAGSAAPVPYMNKILSEWKQAGVFSKKDVPEKAPTSRPFENPAVQALNEKTDRERYYAKLREQAQSAAEKNLRKANANPVFKEIIGKLSKMELSLAKAELSSPDALPSLHEQKNDLLTQKRGLLADMGMTEEMLLPQYQCPKCSDTGYLKTGVACACYRNAK